MSSPPQWAAWQGWLASSPDKQDTCMTKVSATETRSRLSGKPRTTNKMPPAYDGRRLRFAYEGEIDDWWDITEL